MQTYRLSLVDTRDEHVENRAKLYNIAPIKDLEKRGWISKTKNAADLEADLRKFFDVDSFEHDPSIGASFHKTAAEEPINISQKAWCFRARNLARSQQVGIYSQENLEKCVDKLQKLAGWPEETRKVTRILAEAGIRFVVVEPLPHTRVDGVAFWLNDESPVIAMSIRFDRIDSFWHVLGHELSHIRHRDVPVLDLDIVGTSRPSPAEQSAVERRADSEAASMLISTKEMESFIVRVGPLYSRARINQFANRLVVHPGIIVGQLQHRGELGYQSLRDTLVKVRDAVVSEAFTDGWGHVVHEKGL